MLLCVFSLTFVLQAGYNLCAAGWLDKARVAYPMSYSNPKCGFGHVGIVDYGIRNNLSETWDTFCYRVKGKIPHGIYVKLCIQAVASLGSDGLCVFQMWSVSVKLATSVTDTPVQETCYKFSQADQPCLTSCLWVELQLLTELIVLTSPSVCKNKICAVMDLHGLWFESLFFFFVKALKWFIYRNT